MKKLIFALILTVTLTASSLNTVTVAEDINTSEAAMKVKVMMDVINEKYVGEGEEALTNEKMMESAIKGIFDDLDIYSDYYTEEEYDKFIEDVAGKFGGIGVYVTQREENVEVMKPIEGTPGYEAGLTKGDIILKVDNEDVTNYSLNKVVSLIRGEEGTKVTLTILRGVEEIDVEITRDIVEVPSIQVKKLEEMPIEVTEKDDEDYMYIQILDFNQAVAKKIKEQLEIAKEENKKGIIFDVRDNPGGYLDKVVEISRELVKSGPILHTIDKEGNKVTHNSFVKTPPFDLVVITNNHSASASEIFASAVKESGVGKVVGETTFGKGVVQEIRRFQTGDGFKLTMEEYLTRDENKINAIGVTPDYIVEVPLYRVRAQKRLKLNDKSEEVKRLEKILKYLGYNIEEVDEEYTEETFNAVKEFQENNGAYPYGVADFGTQRLINQKVMEKLDEEDKQLQKALEVMKELTK